jgi:hypothetical protein
MPSGEPIAFGLRAHSGWAVLVAVSGSPTTAVVLDRRRLSLCDGSFPRQPYHAAEELPAAKAAALVERSLDTADRLARAEVNAAAKALAGGGRHVAAAGLLLGSARPLPGSLPAILGSHPLIHTAEGEMYRNALRTACERAGIPVVGLRERDISETAAVRLGLDGDALRARLTALGKPLGPPWSQDEKLAALAAWLAMLGPGRPRGRRPRTRPN